MGRNKTNSYRLQVSLSGSLSEKVSTYADVMGVGVPEAARHLMLRGLEQVQLLLQSRDSVDALNRMTAVFDRGLDIEENGKQLKKNPKSSSVVQAGKSVRSLVTPAQSLKNETKSENIEDMFHDARHR